MGSGDLNLKKSWHPGRTANVTRLLKEEAKAREERRKIEERRREIAKELALLEVQRIQEGNGTKVVQGRMDWMVPGDSAPTEEKPKAVQVDEEREAFLLGRPINVIKGMQKGRNDKKEVAKLERGMEEAPERHLRGRMSTMDVLKGEGTDRLRKDSSSSMKSQNRNSTVARSKVLLDPLFQIKRQEKRKHEEMTREREVEERRPRHEIRRHKREQTDGTETKGDSKSNHLRYSHK
jgi:hypothetical protein